ncbi:hypothetical protein [Pontivivens ytuae]|uniref:Uncharacterized protein n=1 Tax=Pontivivens ytuae TaxID=2789856 RepID=A0A7S9QDC8_9RHOB|nr:hypothetical protein [Pontivivens ytuae]QPH54676.1 hypothetical protein I0K15_02520 [Pontivivens ytuae]QPH54755.1 hypothetical protein I0K15_02960 [Pontivivens ytuae]
MPDKKPDWMTDRTITQTFTQSADPKADWVREGKPDPDQVAQAGIKTRESLAWLAAQHPETPAPAYRIDDPGLRDDADRATRQQHQSRIAALHRRLQARAFKGREDFGLAQAPRRRARGQDQGQER